MPSRTGARTTGPWIRLDAATSLVRLPTRPERMPDDTYERWAATPRAATGRRLVEQDPLVQYTDDLLDELPILAGLGDDPRRHVRPRLRTRPDASRQGWR